ncbi:hypothetical protein HK102_004703, partial [Quaeritorhiza haematococci]
MSPPKWQETPHKTLLLGLANAGKTTILHKLVYGNGPFPWQDEYTAQKGLLGGKGGKEEKGTGRPEIITDITFIGMNVETVHYHNVLWGALDMWGYDKIRPLIRCYLCDLPILMYIIDSTDRAGVDNSLREALIALQHLQMDIDASQSLLGKFSKGSGWFKKLVFVANKMDLSGKGAMSVEELLLRIRKMLWEESFWRGGDKGVVGDEWDWDLIPCSATTGEGLQDLVDLVYEELGMVEQQSGMNGKGGGSSSSSSLWNNRWPFWKRYLLKKPPQVELKEGLQST